MEDLRKKINGMFRVCTDNVKVDPKDIEQEKIDDAYNLALTNVLELLQDDSNCEHDWYKIPNYGVKKGDWSLCNKCKKWKQE